MNVVVEDETGKIIGTGTTLPGPMPSAYASLTCILTFEVSGLPDAKFYSVKVGKRGSLSYSHEQLEQNGWKLALSLGT